MSAACLDVRNKSSADPQSLVLRDTQVGHIWCLLGGRVSRTVGNVLVFGPPLHRGTEWRSLRQSSLDGYSVCSGLF